MTTTSTTINLHVGALLDRAPGPKYVGALAFAELAFRAPLPKPKALAQMRKQLPEGFVIALRAPRECVVSSLGALRVTPELETSLNWLLAAADACAARAVLIPTPADFTPGARSRDLLREFVARLPRSPDRHYVWMPSGVWEVHETQTIAAELGIVCGFDPLEAKRPVGPIAYGTLRAMGHRTNFSPAALGDALSTLITAETREVFLSIDADRAFDVARRARQLAVEALTAAADEDELDDEEDEDVISDDEDDLDEDGAEDADDEDQFDPDETDSADDAESDDEDDGEDLDEESDDEESDDEESDDDDADEDEDLDDDDEPKKRAPKGRR